MSRNVDRPPHRALGRVTLWIVIALILLAIPALVYLHFVLAGPLGFAHA